VIFLVSSGEFSCFLAALLLQGSVQVYSRKVEYLYSLVLAALEFLSQKRFGFESPALLFPKFSVSFCLKPSLLQKGSRFYPFYCLK